MFTQPQAFVPEKEIDDEKDSLEIPKLQELLSEQDSRKEYLIKWFAYYSLKRSVLVTTLGLLFPLLISLFAVAAYPLIIDSSVTSFRPKSAPVTLMEDGISRAEEVTTFNPLRNVDDAAATIQQSEYTIGGTVYFWSEPESDCSGLGMTLGVCDVPVIDSNIDADDNIFTESNIREMKNIENHIYNMSQFTATCLRLKGTTVCDKPASFLRVAYAEPLADCATRYRMNGFGSEMLPNLFNETGPLTSLIDSSLDPVFCWSGNCSSACDMKQSKDIIDQFVTTKFTVENRFTDATKMQILFALPLEGYANSKDRRDEQLLEIDSTMLAIEDYIKTVDAPFTLYFLSEPTITRHFDGLIVGDSLLISASIFFVFLYMWFHVKSLFLSSLGIFHIILSFPFGYFFLQVFLASEKIIVLNFMALFIILGIGADDVFIFIDAWKQSKTVVPVKASFKLGTEMTANRFKWMHARLMWAYRRSAWAMLVTSLTTSMAFLMNLVSNIPAIQVFGFFTGCMVITNYFMVISYFPAAAMTYEMYIKSRVCGCWNPCCEYDLWKQPCAWGRCCFYGNKTKGAVKNVEKTEETTDGVIDIEKYRFLERMLYKHFAPWVHKVRWAIVVVFVGIYAVTGVYAVQLEPAEEPTQWVPSYDYVQQLFILEGEAFVASDFKSTVWFTTGVNPIDRDGTNPYKTDDIGAPQFDDEFDLSVNESLQELYIENCNIIRSWDYLVISNTTDIICPMEQFREYILDEKNESFPVPKEQVVAKLAEFAQHHETSVGLAPDVSLLNNAIDREERREKPVTFLYESMRFAINETDGELKLMYMATVANMTTTRRSNGQEIEPLKNYFGAQLAKLKTAPGLPRPRDSAPSYVTWAFEADLYVSAYIGLGLSLSLSFLIILLSTKDVILTCLATFTIVGIVLALVASAVWQGWQLGVIESICLTILVGLSVDYTIHIANSWRENKIKVRKQRLQATLFEIGISILSSSITTLLACMPLFFAYIIFFKRFGIFIALTIFWSTLFAFTFFAAILVICGPVSNRNDFVWLWRKITCASPKPVEANKPTSIVVTLI
eukprot:m.233765 g.233765  ORF g.233765 m.233765 type:complete len:1065 (-) comp33647_c0_seq2:2081-5275(-)